MAYLKIIGLSVFVLFTMSVFSQESNQKYEFQKYGKSRTVKLKPETEITVVFNPTFDEKMLDTVENSVLGNLISVDGNTLKLSVGTEYSNYTFTSDSIYETYRKFSYNNPKSYSSSQINYITYTSKARPIIELSTFASVMTLLVIAPIFSFNFSERTFNGDAYMAYATPAALATIITLPFYFNLDERKATLIKK